MNAEQISKIIMLVLACMSLGIIIAKFGEERSRYGVSDIISFVLTMILYYGAGIFDIFK